MRVCTLAIETRTHVGVLAPGTDAKVAGDVPHRRSLIRTPEAVQAEVEGLYAGRSPVQ